MTTDSAPAGLVLCVRADCQGGGAGAIDESGFCDHCNRAAAPLLAAVPGPRWVPSPAAAWPADPPIWDRVAWETPGRPGGDRTAPLTFPPGLPARPLGRAELGMGVFAIPPVPPRDPRSLLIDDPAEASRRCPRPACREPLGRGADGRPGPLEGECPACGTRYSFWPALHQGEVLGQYEVLGCIGYGGQGSVYLASDANLDSSLVAIKGQRGYASDASQAAAIAERQTLIALRHPDIVDIRNFIQRPDPASGRVNGYIVMEFLDGESLADKIADRRLPVAQAVSYILAVLPALGYLHESGLLYGDFKPANVMQVRDRIKLIDLGGVTRIDNSGRYKPVATRGFVAPEVRQTYRPTVRSDLYAVGRTLAVLTMPFDHAEEHETTLPAPASSAVLAQHESFYRFLRRATDPDPARRFGSAAAMAGQLAGVLREVVTVDSLRPLPPMPSARFTTERDVVTIVARPARDAAAALPVPLPDDTDPAAAFLETVTAADPDEVIAQLRAAPAASIEVAFQRALAGMSQPDFTGDGPVLEVPPGADPDDWRFTWYRGLGDLAAGRLTQAWVSFAEIRDLLPGELAPKLALAVCAELLEAPALARHYYETVWRAGRGYVGAAFGVARTYAAEPGEGSTDDAIEVLESIPESLRHQATARMEALTLRLQRPGLSEAGLHEAADRLQKLGLQGEQALRQRIKLWGAARDWLTAGGVPAGTARPLLGVPLAPDALGRALEGAYLGLRRFVPDRRDRVDLVRRAHAVRPRTRW
jgi:serine/threonine-protein kinase PknG